MRDYEAWHEAYADADSPLSWRLATAQRHIGAFLDERPGLVRVLSLCAGEGRDVLGALAVRPDAARVAGALVELHPAIAARARAAAEPYPALEVRTADAADPAVFADVVPVDLLLLVGIFGNISADDRNRVIDAVPQLCAPRAAVLWSRSEHDRGDGNRDVRDRFAAAGCAELDYRALDAGIRPALGLARFAGVTQPLRDEKLFTFVR